MTDKSKPGVFESVWNKISGPSKPTKVQAGSGIEVATTALGSRAYQLHKQEAKAMGETPMTPTEFAKTQ